MKRPARGARCHRAIGMLAAAVVVLLAPGAALPAPRSGSVILVDAPNSSSTVRHCLTRIREELVAGGFDVVLVDPGPSLDPVSIAGFMARQQGAVATIALVGDPDAAGAELWIVDRVGPVPEVRRIPAPTDRDRLPEVFAIRTFEVLKASALKALVEATHPAPELS